MANVVRDREGNEYKERESLTISFFYGTLLGRSITKILSKPMFSKIAGSFLSKKTSKVMIRTFVKKNKIEKSKKINSL